MRNKVFVVLAALGLFVNAGFSAVNINVPCDFLAISNACATAKEGDTVIIGPGDCYLSNHIIMNRGVSFNIKGAGTNLTTLRAVDGLDYPLYVNVTSKNLVTISDLNCVGNQAQMYGFIMVGRNVGATTFNGPVRITRVQMTNILYRGINMGSGDSYGVIDHCYFVAPTSYHNQPISFGGNSFASWKNPNPLGTTNVVCVEDCRFEVYTNGGNGFFDAYDGAQLVWRHNYCSGTSIAGVHGYDSQPTSCRTWEIYNNFFTNGAVNSLTFELRGGTGVLFSNVVDKAADFCELAYYRSCGVAHAGTVAAYGFCDSHTTNTLDGNRSTNKIAFGNDGYQYPANQQPGVIQSTATNAFRGSNIQITHPCYSWSNIFRGQNAGFTLKDMTSDCGYSITNIVKLNRDYFNDTVAPGYVPLPYPHPLAGGTAAATKLAPPTNLRMVSTQ